MLEKENVMEAKEKNVVVIDKLERADGEVDFSQLSDADKFQLVCRYFNDLCSITKSLLQIQADQYVLVEFLCNKLGIDVKKEKQELAKRIKAQMEENIQKGKEQLEKVAKDN